jgi:hypothetical protein
MGVFKVYADDSGDDADPQHAVISVAGYLSDVSRWSTFEVRWDEVLRKYEVEYLHMKEWWDRDGTYKELKKDKEREASFFRDLVQVIRDNITYCVSSVVRLNDFQRFNSENGLALDAFSQMGRAQTSREGT